MSNIPEGLKYTKEHEWLKPLADGSALVGITDYAQQSLGDITFVELPSAGETLDQQAAFGVVESVKAASDLYMPVAAEVLDVNALLEDAPETLNEDPYDKGWLLKIKPADTSALDGLMSAADYRAHVGE